MTQKNFYFSYSSEKSPKWRLFSRILSKNCARKKFFPVCFRKLSLKISFSRFLSENSRISGQFTVYSLFLVQKSNFISFSIITKLDCIFFSDRRLCKTGFSPFFETRNQRIKRTQTNKIRTIFTANFLPAKIVHLKYHESDSHCSTVACPLVLKNSQMNRIFYKFEEKFLKMPS